MKTTGRSVWRLVLIAAMFIVPLAGAEVLAVEAPVSHVFLLPDCSGVRMDIPSFWSVKESGQLENVPPIVECEDTRGGGFSVNIRLVPLDKNVKVAPMDLEIKKQVQMAADAASPKSAEKSIRVLDFPVGSGYGYYFEATGKPSGDAASEHILYGGVRVGPAFAIFTTFSRSDLAKETPDVIAILKTARFSSREVILGEHTPEEHLKTALRFECGGNEIQDLDSAIHFFRLAAERGNAEAQYNLAYVYSKGDGPFAERECIRLATEAAKKGNPEAQALLGGIYSKSRKGAQDAALALQWNSAAATQGVAVAMRTLGRFYIDGTGVAPNASLALKWLTAAANTGDDSSMFELGCAYLNGKTVPRDLKAVDRWMYKAALAGSKDAVDYICGGHPPFSGQKEMTGRETWDYLCAEMRAHEIREIAGNDPFLINVGDSTAKVISVLGPPMHGLTCPLIYPSGFVFVKDGVVTKSNVQLLSEQARKKLTASGQLYDLAQAPFLQPEDPKYWAMAASALLTELNNERHDLLGSRLPKPIHVKRERWALYRWWGVTNRKSLLSQLDWIDSGGHRFGFDQMTASLDAMTPAQLNAATIANPEVKTLLEQKNKVGKKSLIGWDYCRYISLCRWGCLVGYLTEQEAWTRIMPVAIKLQKTFDSWADLGENYLVGREFWSEKETDKSGRKLREKYDELLKDSWSPWNRCKWAMDLSRVSP